jgi:hypothetical protein
MELRREAQLERHHPEDPSDLVKARERRNQLQSSPPPKPKQPSLRRHSFATRKESPLPNQEELDAGDTPSPYRPSTRH